MSNLLRPSLSIVIGITEASQYISLLHDASMYLSRCVELVVVDQVTTHHSHRIDSPYSRVLFCGRPIGASKARNIGACNASGLYVWFVDSDCTFGAGSFSTIVAFISKNSHLDLLIFDRVYSRECSSELYCKPASSSGCLSPGELLHSVTEWNFAVKKSLFLNVKGFPLIGTGSTHPAQSGECYGLICKILSVNPLCAKVDDVRVVHPHYAARKPFFKALGYYYGAGYAVCRYSPLLKGQAALVQLSRNLAGTAYVLFRPLSDMLLPELLPLFNLPILIRPLLLLARFAGSLHGLFAFARSLCVPL